METLKKIKKRILPLVLAVVISATSIVSGPASLTARAASFAVTSDLTVEFVMLLYNIFETISIASGMKEGLDDYSKGMSIFDAFISFLDGLSYDPFEEFTIYGTDGTALTRDEFNALWEAAVGNAKLKVRPNEGEFAKYRVLTGGAAPTPSPDPSASPVPTAIPGPGHGTDLNPEIPKRAIRSFTMGTDMQFQRTVSDFLTKVQENAVPEVDPAEYYGTVGLFDGSYLSSELAIFDYTTINGKWSLDMPDHLNLGIVCSESYIRFYEYSVRNNSCGNVSFFFNGYYFSDPSKSLTTYFSYIALPLADGYFYSTNLPFFESDVAMKNFYSNYLKTGNIDYSYLLNAVPYDYRSMTASAPDTLDQLTGAQVSADKLPDLNNSMREAANSVEPGTDKDENNAALIAAVKAAVAEALPEVQPDPDPQPSTAPDPSPSTAPDPDAGTGTYSGILGLILAAIQAIASQIWDYFSHPFGSIIEGITNIVELLPKVNELVQALPASIFGFFQVPLDLITSGITNLYNGVLRIIELLPEQVQLVLGNIVSLPSAMLQAFADPLGAIQSLLGALPSWANLQGYLDKILDALVDPGSLLEPSDPGGEDPGGDGSGGGSKFNLLSLLNGLIYLILILILLLKIFIHCLQFIINIFKIEASPGFLPDEMVMGLNFLKQIEITGIGLSIYDFMMGLVYILMVFGVVKLLRGYAYKIHIPSGGGK